MRDVLSELAKAGVVQVRDKTGAKMRRARIQHDSDVVTPSRQTRLFMK